MAFQAKRVRRTFSHRVMSPPDRVFPLLCPVREHEWIDGWQAEIVFSERGGAEDHCVFRTDTHDRGLATWVVSVYDPHAHRIGFTIFYPDRYVERLDLGLEAEPPGATRLVWTRTYTGLSEAGNDLLEEATGARLDQRMHHAMASLEHFCATGSCLRA
jgi:hypothetical protein